MIGFSKGIEDRSSPLNTCELPMTIESPIEEHSTPEMPSPEIKKRLFEEPKIKNVPVAPVVPQKKVRKLIIMI